MAKSKSLQAIYNLIKKKPSGIFKLKLPKSKFKMPKVGRIKARRIK